MGWIRFGDFEIDGEALELRRGGEPVVLSPQAVRALIVLVRSEGRLVTREELYAELWPERGVDVDRGLNTLIRQIRIALGDNAKDPVYVRTYPRRGYRFIVGPEAAASIRGSGRPEGGTGTAWTRRARWRRWAGGVAATAILAVLAVVIRASVRSDSPAEGAVVRGDDADLAMVAGLGSEVRERFLEGRYLIEHGSPERRAEAVDPFRQVVAAAPDFAPGHAWLADALFWAGRLEAARSAAAAALDLDGGQDRALIVRGTVRLIRDWDPEGAERDIREAVRLAGDEPEPHHALAFVLATAGRHAEAVRELETAHRLDPISAIVTGDLGLIHLYAGNLEEAARYCERAVALEPAAVWAIQCAFDALAHQGRHERARPHASRLVDRAGEVATAVLGGPGIEDSVAVTRFRAWRADRAQRALANGGSAWAAALALADAGRTGEAVEALERAANERGPGFVTITVDPRFRPLWSEPGFQSLAADLTRHGFAPAS